KWYGCTIDVIGELTVHATDMHFAGRGPHRTHEIFLYELRHTRGRCGMIRLGFEDLVAGRRIDGRGRRLAESRYDDFLALLEERDRIEGVRLVDQDRIGEFVITDRTDE